MENYSFEDYVAIIKRLRAPGGCPWDRAQTHESLKTCMINETAEAIAAVDVLRETKESGNLCEELGDLLLLVVLQSEIAAEEGLFDIYDVIQAAGEKMIRRHPHVFSKDKMQDEPDWETLKQAEKAGIPPEVEASKKRQLQKAREDIIAQCTFSLKSLDKKSNTVYKL